MNNVMINILNNYMDDRSILDPNDVTVIVTVNSYFLTTNTVKRIVDGMWINDEVLKLHVAFFFYLSF